MTKPRPYQLRIFLNEEFADAARHHKTTAGLEPLLAVLKKHHAALDHNQLDEFTEFLATMDAHPEIPLRGAGKRLYDLTKGALANPEKCSYFAREFTISVGGKMTFVGHDTDALVEDLKKLGSKTVLTRGKAFREGKVRNVSPVRKVYIPKRHPGT